MKEEYVRVYLKLKNRLVEDLLVSGCRPIDAEEWGLDRCSVLDRFSAYDQDTDEDRWSLCYVLTRIFLVHGCDEILINKVVYELGKVDEWREQLVKFFPNNQ